MKFNSINKRVLALIGAGIILVSASGCTKKQENKQETIGYSVSDSTFNHENGLYSYVIDRNGFESEKYNFDTEFNDKSFAKIDEKDEYGTNSLNKQTTAGYIKLMKLVWPDCYKEYPLNSSLSHFDINIKYEKVQEYHGETYLVVYTSATSNHDFKERYSNSSKDYVSIKKGDNMSSVAIYYQDELIAYKQTGIGCESKNVQDSIVGDVDIALKTVQEIGLISEKQDITSDELYEYQESLNQKDKVLILK